MLPENRVTMQMWCQMAVRTAG